MDPDSGSGLWILILKINQPVVMGRGRGPGLSVFTACLFVMRIVCSWFRACTVQKSSRPYGLSV